MSKPRKPSETAERLHRAIRVTSAQSNLFSSAVAARLGITVNDLECLDIIHLHGPLTAGALAERTGLTTGAITGIVDRLAAVGFVRREPDPDDRRRVIVRTQPKAGEKVQPLYNSLARRMDEVVERYREEDLAVLIDYYEMAAEVLRDETRRLREAPPEGRARDREARAKRRAESRGKSG